MDEFETQYPEIGRLFQIKVAENHSLTLEKSPSKLANIPVYGFSEK